MRGEVPEGIFAYRHCILVEGPGRFPSNTDPTPQCLSLQVRSAHFPVQVQIEGECYK